MALTQNLVLAKEPGSPVAEAMAHRQPGDKLTVTLELCVVENLNDRATFDVKGVEFGSGSAPAKATGGDSVLAQSVLGVMSRKPGKKSGY